MARARNEGFILVAVLGVMAMMTSLAGGTSLLLRAAFDGLRGNGETLKLDALIRAGIDLAGFELYGLKLTATRITGQEIRLDDGTLTLSVSDEAGKIDLNGSDPVLIARAYHEAGLRSLDPKDFAARVVAWRERDAPAPQSARPANARETKQDVTQEMKKEGFRTVSDLRWLPGLAAEETVLLASFFTVHNPLGKINVLAASSEVLLCLPEMTPALAAQVLALRQVPSPNSGERITQMLQKQNAFIQITPGRAFRVAVTARSGPVATRRADVTIAKAPQKIGLYFVTARNE